MSLHLFGLSIVGLRLASVLAQAAIIVVSGLMACDLGGNRLAQFTAALTVGLSPLLCLKALNFNTPHSAISGGYSQAGCDPPAED